MDDPIKHFKRILFWSLVITIPYYAVPIYQNIIFTHLSDPIVKLSFKCLPIYWLIGIPLYVIFKRKDKFREYLGSYKSTKKLKSKDFGIENYIPAPDYINRQSDEDIEKLVLEGKHVLILGQAKIGKTSAAFKIIKKLENSILIKPKIKSFEIKDIPYPFSPKRNLILFFDNIDKYNGELINELIKYLKNKSKELIVIATCRSGTENDDFKEQSVLMGLEFHEVRLDYITKEDGMKLASVIRRDWNTVGFDGTPGCITLNPEVVLKAMQIKYKAAGKGKHILRAIKLLKEGGFNFYEVDFYETELVKKICKDIFELSIKKHEWSDMTEYLINNSLIKSADDYINIHGVYLDYCVDKDDFCPTDYFDSLRKIVFDRGKLIDIVHLGYGYVHRKDFINSKECFKFALDIYPKYVPALNGLGTMFIELGKNKEGAGKKEESKNDFREAIIYLENSKDIKSLASTHRKLGYAYSLLKDYRNAEQEYRISIKISPNYFGAQAALGYLLVDLEKYDEGEKALEKAIRINPYSSLAHCNLGFCLKLEGKIDDAKKEFRKAIDLDKSLPQAHKQLASLLANENNKEAKEEAEREFRCVVKLSPNDPVAHADFGYFLANNTKNYDETEDEYKKALDLDPNYVEVLNNYGCFLRNREKPKKAEEMHRKAIKIDDDSALLHNNLALDLRVQGKEIEASYELEKALKINPEYMEAYPSLGYVLTELKEYEKATKIYRKAYELKPHYKDIAIKYVIAAEKTETADEILQIYDELFKTQPDNINLVKTFAQYLYKFRNKTNVLEIFDKMIQANPKSLIKDNPDILALKGEILRKTGKFEPAEECTKKALDLDPENIIANKNYAILKESAGDREQNEQTKLKLYNIAEEFYKKVLLLASDHPSVHRHLGNLLAKLKGRDHEAENEYKAIKTKRPYPENHRDYGVFLFDRGRIDEGKKELNAAIDLFREEHNDNEVQNCKDILKKHGY